ncbi:MAG: DUF4393 domain-containing protein [Bacteroidetes bacterium]|nr:DUF4393 domain-containing protein [Bacteroidota bacterium]
MSDSVDKYGVGKAAEVAADFLHSILTQPIQELNGLVADKIKFWRFKNQVDILLKAKKYLESKGINANKIPLKSVSNLLEYASLEEDEDMQDKWAALLANAVRETKDYDLTHIFSQILNQLSAQEVAVLDHMFSRCFFKSDRDRPFIEKGEITRLSFTTYYVTLLIFDNLLRLRLIEEEPPKIKFEKDELTYDMDLTATSLTPSTKVRLSEFGVEFVKQCRFR